MTHIYRVDDFMLPKEYDDKHLKPKPKGTNVTKETLTPSTAFQPKLSAPPANIQDKGKIRLGSGCISGKVPPQPKTK